MKIEFDFTDREKKVIEAMCEFLDEPDPKTMIEKVLSEKWKTIKSPKPINLNALAGIGIKKAIEHFVKSR